MKIVTVVGARPQFIKAAAFSTALADRQGGDIREVLVHTGQHHDARMSGVFFEELGIADPAYNLGVSGGTHGAMTGRMLEALEQVLVIEKPDWVLVYGDTNSTLAAALAASKLHMPIAHVEAGLRSFNNRMPEEINRIVADRLSSLLLCPTEASMRNLAAEGLTRGAHQVGDIMYDAALRFAAIADRRADILSRMEVAPKSYVLATCHRAENTDDATNLEGIVRGLASIATSMPVVFPVHPRTHAKLRQFGLDPLLKGVTVTEPLSYLDMVALEKSAALIVTDSGGVQKEAYFYRVPCVTVRNETEWIETVDAGWNTLAGSDAIQIMQAFKRHAAQPRRDIDPYGAGDAAERIVDLLLASN